MKPIPSELEKIYTFVCKYCGENVKVTGGQFDYNIAGVVVKCPECLHDVGCESPFSFDKR